MGNFPTEACCYAAGLLDGEGSIVVTDNDLKVRISMIHRAGIDFLLATFGGRLYDNQTTKTGGRRIFDWNLSGKFAAPFLEAVHPHARVKKIQIEIALTILSLRPGRGNELEPEDASLIDELRTLLKVDKESTGE